MGRVISQPRALSGQAPAEPVVYDVPAGVGDAGAELWREVTASVNARWALYAKDLANLTLAAKTADTIATLEAALAKDIEKDELMVSGSTGQERLNPIVGELRAQRAALASLLKLVETEPPPLKTGRMNSRQRDRSLDAQLASRPPQVARLRITPPGEAEVRPIAMDDPRPGSRARNLRAK